MTTPRTIMGIDPGLDGAVAVLTLPGNMIAVEDTPLFIIDKKKRLDVHGLERVVRDLVNIYEPVMAVVENVFSMPKQGVASSFSFGHVVGATQMALAAHHVPMKLVTPVAWKRLLNLSANKDDSRRLASRLYPAFAALWARAKDDGRAEAVLLAYYGSLTNPN